MTKDQKLAYKFLHDFSRFEFALKTTGFYIKGSHEAKPDWDTFAHEIDNGHKITEIASEEFQRSIKYFLNTPPRKQIINGNKMTDWEEHERGAGDFKEVIVLVRRVRNNFFHGGKFVTGHVRGSERDADLLMHALVILSICLELNQDVKNRFFEE